MSEDFQEEDIWAKMPNSRKTSTNPPLPSAHPASRRVVPAAAPHWGIIHRGQKASPPRRSSAPVSIPDWSKIIKNPTPNRNPWDDDHHSCEGGGAEDDLLRHLQRGTTLRHVDEDDEDDDDVVPPHEYLARRLARTQVASFSMCEGGIGRTLKGRDLSNLRNAILSKTGFLE